MPDLKYDLSTADLLTLQDLILWAKQFRYKGTVMTATQLVRFDELVVEIDRIIVLRAAAGDQGSMEGAAEVLIRKPAGSAVHGAVGAVHQKTSDKTGTGSK